MKLISWNTNHKTRKCADQVKALLARSPDVLALQEVTKNTTRLWRKLLRGTELVYTVDSFELAGDRGKLTGPRQYGELIASRWPSYGSRLVGAKWPERAVATFIKSPFGKVELVTTGIPPGRSNGWTKIGVLKGVYDRLAHKSPHLRILCGDFNTPQEELSDGRIVTWAQRYVEERKEVFTSKKIEGRNGADWDQGERHILEGLEDFGLVEVYRRVHGYRTDDFSWLDNKGQGRRYDHIFASIKLRPVGCTYLHNLRESGLSDHSPLEVNFHPDQSA